EKRAGHLAALALAVTWGFWVHSGVALSDMLGLALSLAATWAFLHGCSFQEASASPKAGHWFMAGCALGALSLGVRPQNALPAVLAGLYALIPLLQAWRWRALLLALALGVAFGLIWLIPTLHTTGGLPAYLDLLS